MTGSGVSVGDTVAGYRIDAVAGRGGMGVVYKATQLRLGRTVALKAIAPQLATDPDFRARFQREAQLAASIEHPNVIPVYQADELETGELFLAMRWVEGTDLREMLAIEHRLAPARAVNVLAPVAYALDAAHARGLIHRDVKPANVLIAEGAEGRPDHVYLTDFGIARLSDEEHGLTQTGAFVGTLAYAAPERIKGERGGPAADIYALGCVLFETLTGRPPFNRENEMATMFAHLNDPIPALRDEVAEVPPALDDVVRTALAKEPGERFADAEQMGKTMEAALAGAGEGTTAPLGQAEPATPPAARAAPATTSAGRAAPTEPAEPREPNRRRWPLLAGAVLAVVVVAAVIVAISTSGSSSPNRGGKSSPNSSQASTPSSNAHIAVSSLGQLPSGAAPGAIAVIDSQTTAVTAPASDAVVLMYRSGRPAKSIPVGAGPNALAVDRSGHLWVADTGSDAVRVIEPGSGRTLANIKVGSAPAAIAIGGGDAWIADQGSNDVRRIDLQTLHTVGAPIKIPGQQPSALAYDPSGAVWVVNKGTSDVSVIRDGSAATAQFVSGGPISVSAGATPGVWVGTTSGTVTRLSQSGAPQGQALQLHGGAAMVAILGNTVWVVTHDDATLSSVSATATPAITARQSMSPAEAPVALACVPHECAVSDQPTRQVVIASF